MDGFTPEQKGEMHLIRSQRYKSEKDDKSISRTYTNIAGWSVNCLQTRAAAAQSNSDTHKEPKIHIP